MTGVIHTYLWDPMRREPSLKRKTVPYWLRVPGHNHVMLSLLHMDYMHSTRHGLHITVATRKSSKLKFSPRSSWPTQVFDADQVIVLYNTTMYQKAKGFRLIYSFHPVCKRNRYVISECVEMISLNVCIVIILNLVVLQNKLV